VAKFLRISVDTQKRIDFVNITKKIQYSVSQSDISDGLCVIFIPHTTAAVVINEGADPDVVRDLEMELNKMIPLSDNYAHSEGNSAAHIKASILGSSVTIFVEDGLLQLGTWQAVFFCEFDGPRHREVWIKTMN